MSRERYSRLGIPQSHWSVAKNVERRIDDFELTPKQLDIVLERAAQYDGKTEEDFWNFVDQTKAAADLSDMSTDLLVSFREQVNERGIENMPQLPQQVATAADRTEMETIRAEMGKDRRESKYWRNDLAGERMRDRYEELIETLGNKASEPAPAAVPTADDEKRKAELLDLIRRDPHRYYNSPTLQGELQDINRRAERGESIVAPVNPSNDAARKSEIYEMMKDTGSDYYHGPHSERLQGEYRSLVEREGPNQQQTFEAYDTH